MAVYTTKPLDAEKYQKLRRASNTGYFGYDLSYFIETGEVEISRVSNFDKMVEDLHRIFDGDEEVNVWELMSRYEEIF